MQFAAASLSYGLLIRRDGSAGIAAGVARSALQSWPIGIVTLGVLAWIGLVPDSVLEFGLRRRVGLFVSGLGRLLREVRNAFGVSWS